MKTSQAIFVNPGENYNNFGEANDCIMFDSNPSQNKLLNDNPFFKFNSFNIHSKELSTSRQAFKDNRFNDLKRNTLDRMKSRVQKYREDRMDKVFYGKQAIIENLKNEIYDDIKYYTDDEFNEYVKEYFSHESLSFYFDQLAYYFDKNKEVHDLTEYEANIYQNDHIISFCPYCSELVFKSDSHIFCSKGCFNYNIGTFEANKVNLGHMMTSLKNILEEHPNCGKSFEMIECNDRIIFFCTKCLI